METGNDAWPQAERVSGMAAKEAGEERETGAARDDYGRIDYRGCVEDWSDVY